jgi:hypothetical protein
VTDCIKLKYGRRVSQYGIVSITEFLNYLLASKSGAVIKSLSFDVKIKIAETLSLLYYYKHNQVLSLFQKSQLDFNQSKHLFNHHIFQLAGSCSNPGE